MTIKADKLTVEFDSKEGKLADFGNFFLSTHLAKLTAGDLKADLAIAGTMLTISADSYEIRVDIHPLIGVMLSHCKDNRG